MRAAVKRSLQSVIVFGVLTFSAVGAITPGQARGGHGGSGGQLYFLGITGAGGGYQGGSGGQEARDPRGQRPGYQYGHRVAPGDPACDPLGGRPPPPYCQ